MNIMRENRRHSSSRVAHGSTYCYYILHVHTREVPSLSLKYFFLERGPQKYYYNDRDTRPYTPKGLLVRGCFIFFFRENGFFSPVSYPLIVVTVVVVFAFLPKPRTRLIGVFNSPLHFITTPLHNRQSGMRALIVPVFIIISYYHCCTYTYAPLLSTSTDLYDS